MSSLHKLNELTLWIKYKRDIRYAFNCIDIRRTFWSQDLKHYPPEKKFLSQSNTHQSILSPYFINLPKAWYSPSLPEALCFKHNLNLAHLSRGRQIIRKIRTILYAFRECFLYEPKLEGWMDQDLSWYQGNNIPLSVSRAG